MWLFISLQLVNELFGLIMFLLDVVDGTDMMASKFDLVSTLPTAGFSPVFKLIACALLLVRFFPPAFAFDLNQQQPAAHPISAYQ